jgi:O-antigen/teichoic acid export membrane protein
MKVSNECTKNDRFIKSSKYNLNPIREVLYVLKSGLFKRTFIYTFSSSFATLVSFLLLPILTRYLSQYDYGIIATFSAVTACLTGVIGMGSNVLLSRNYFKLEVEERKKYIANILELIFLNSLFILSIFLLFSNFFLNIIKFNKTLLFLVILVSFGSMICAILLTLFQLEKNAVEYAIFSNSNTLISIGISLFLILVVGLKWEGRIIGITLSNLFFLFITIFIFKKKKIVVNFSKKYFKELIFLGSPLIAAHISGWANSVIDRLMINILINIEATGLYDIGYKFGMVIMMIEVAFSKAWLPFFYEKIEGNKKIDRLKIVKVTYIYSAGLFVFTLFYAFFGKYLLYLMVDRKFYAAGEFIFLISMAYCFDGIAKLFTGYIIYEGRTKMYTFIIALSAGVNVILNYILLNRIGLIGAAWATFISFGVQLILTITLANKYHPMPWFFTRVKNI